MSFVRRHRVAIALALVAASVAAVVVGFALASHGYRTRHVNLNDGGIWVTSDKNGLYGRLNKPAGALDLAINPPGGAQSDYQLDVRQQGAAVAAWDQGTGKLMPVDVTDGLPLPDQGVPVSDSEQVAMNGGTLAVLDPATNRVWATHIDPVAGIQSLAPVDPSAKPVITFPAVAIAGTTPRGASLAVGTDGTVYAATTQGVVATVHPKGEKFAKATLHQLGQPLSSVEITAVGTAPVVLDPVQGQLYLPGDASATVKADPDAQLQQPSDADAQVAVATTTQLFGVPLKGGTAVSLFDGGSGAPAAPTRLGDCLHSAWAGNPGVYARACGTDLAKALPLAHGGALDKPVFRVNRGSILLNDLAVGTVYDLDTLQQVQDWSAVKPPPVVQRSTKNKNTNTNTATRDHPPQANPDNLGARPGRTTVLHVLDNDSDPQGAILAVTRISDLDTPSARVTVAPDGQSVDIAMPADVPAVHFRYTVDDGKGLTAQTTVTVAARSPDQNGKPYLRKGFKQSGFSVSAGGTLDLPVLDDWRDPDGDPVVITKATPAAQVTTTSDGRLEYFAPANGTRQTITYEVSDGRADPVAQEVPVTVLSPQSGKTAAPTAEPDTARGEVGHPITVKPLANDLPGADPTNPTAMLAIAGTIASPAGVTVTTDLKSDTVTINATRHGTFLLSYTAAYGDAPFSKAQIRVDVANAPPSPQSPVAVPDTGVLYGQNASTVDVLANDFDPGGGVLVVQHAAAVSGNDQLQVAIVDGHFLRVQSSDSTLSPNPQVIDYTITDGLTPPVTGELTVTQVPVPANDTPVAVDDYVTVRSGDSALIPVLDNDIDPAGAPLSLLDNVTGAPTAGQLSATTGTGASAGAGSAFVSGAAVRYAAPVVAAETPETISYVVHNPSGARATGTVHVTVAPPPSVKNPDQSPQPQPINARAVSGDTISIQIPSTGNDPDGDTTTITGITAAPTLGRVLSIGATTITYEAFPTESGTDRFGYTVSDPYGKTASSTISVGVAPASDPQPPVAVDDTVTAAPGAKVRVDVMGNDIVAPDDQVSIGSLAKVNPELPAGTKLRGAGGPIQVTAAARNGRSQLVLYSLSDGIGQPSTAAITVHSQTGYVPPPAAADAVAVPKPGAATVAVDVLAKDTDPQVLPLRIIKVFDTQATFTGATVTLPVLNRVQNVVYEIENSQGATAAAVIHVPARGTGVPYAKAGRQIAIARNGSKTVDIADYAIDPTGKALRLTTVEHLAGAPADGVKVTSPDPTHLTVTGTDGYVGPAAITFQVTDGKSLSDPAARLALITVPVQVGPDTPVLRCPTAPIQVVEGGAASQLDITALCHVWLGNSADLGKLSYRGTWASQPHDVTVLGNGSHQLAVRAAGAAKPGMSGKLRITVDGVKAAASTLNITVIKLGPPSVRSFEIDGVKAGTTVTRDIRGYVSSPLRDAADTVVSIRQDSGQPARITMTGSRFSITPAATSHGTMTFAMVVSDVASRTRKDRQVTGEVTLNVLNVPDAPGAPRAGTTVLSRTVVLAWPTPAANGAPIESYQVQWPGGSQNCAASPCRIVGLRNGSSYAFTVRARNAVGYSKPSSALAPPAKPDTLPGAVGRVATSNPQDHQLLVTWTTAVNEGSAILHYIVSWTGGGRRVLDGSARSVTATGLDNHNVYTFTVVAVNAKGAGPTASATGQSAGTPPTPTGVAVNYVGAAGTTTRTVNVTWNASDANGAGPTTYSVTRDNTPICANTQATSCTDTPASAQTYTYHVTARNAVGHTSAAGASAPFAVAGTPDSPGGVGAAHTATDGQLTVTYRAPDAHGKDSTIKCTYNGGSCGTWAGEAAGAGATHTVSGLPKDADITITLVDCNEQQCGTPASAPSRHTSGPPHAATGGSCGRSNQTVTWNWGQPAAINGYTVSKYRISVDGNSTTVTASQYSKSEPADGNNRTLSVTAIDSRGESSASANTISCPDAPVPTPPSVSVTPGEWTNSVPGCTNVGCHAVHVVLRNFPANSKVTFHRFWTPSDDGGSGGSMTITVDGSGGWTGTDEYYGGGNSGGNGVGTVSIIVDNPGNGKYTDSCHADWHVESTNSCD